jgi:hypothetical protein
VLDDPTPTNFGNAGCPGMVRYGHGQWTSCGAEPEVAGFPDRSEYVPVARRGTYLLFTCRAHIRLVTDPRPMTEADRTELEHRREQDRLGLAGRPYERVQPIKPSRKPLAV